jgi:hypothetical protein
MCHGCNDCSMNLEEKAPNLQPPPISLTSSFAIKEAQVAQARKILASVRTDLPGEFPYRFHLSPAPGTRFSKENHREDRSGGTIRD